MLQVQVVTAVGTGVLVAVGARVGVDVGFAGAVVEAGFEVGDDFVVVRVGVGEVVVFVVGVGDWVGVDFPSIKAQGNDGLVDASVQRSLTAQ